jgi:flagellar hook-associated protein 2
VLSIKNQIRSVLNTAPVGLTGSYDALSQVGIGTDADTGLLSFTSSDFEDALDTDFTSVAELFAHDDQGFAFRFEAMASDMLDTDGIVDSRQDGLNDRIDDLQEDQLDIERRLELKEVALRAQYSALDSLIGSLNTTSQFLMQQLG